MSTYVCSDTDHIVIAIADPQPDPRHPPEAVRLQSVRQAMAEGVPLPAVVVKSWRGTNFLVAGWHSCAVAVERGLTHLPVRFAAW
jgi:hypothetical protein